MGLSLWPRPTMDGRYWQPAPLWSPSFQNVSALKVPPNKQLYNLLQSSHFVHSKEVKLTPEPWGEFRECGQIRECIDQKDLRA